MGEPTAERTGGTGVRRDARRIASSLFCGSDPVVVAFAKARTAQFWGLPEDIIDVLVAVELLAGTTRLADDLASPRCLPAGNDRPASPRAAMRSSHP